MNQNKIITYPKSKIIEYSILIVATATSSLFIFRSHFQNLMLGESVDTRLYIALLEHWLRVFQDPSNFRDVYFFYPVTNGLGYSDGHLLFSIPYSILRSLNFSLVTAWSITTILVHLVGSLGWILLSRKLLLNFATQIFFVLTMSLSATLVTRIEGLPTSAAGFTLISFVFLFLYKIFYEKNQKNKFFTLLCLVLYLILLALTLWYVAFFAIVHSSIFSLLFLFHSRKTINLKVILYSFFYNLAKLQSLIIVILIIFFTSIWLSIYLPVATQPTRPWWEVYKNSSSLKHVFFSSYLNNGFMQYFFNFGYSTYPEERLIGLPILLSISFILIFLVFLISKKNLPKINLANFSIINSITALLISLIFMRLGNNFSLFKVFWEFFPGLNSIRAPSRYTIILYFAISILLFVLIDAVYNLQKIVFFIFMFVISVDQIKPAAPRWNGNEYVSKSTFNNVTFLKQNCEYFILEIPGGWWNDKAQAIGLAQISNIRSATGGSGGYPRGYPEQRPSDEGDLMGLLAWSNFGLDEKKGCLIIDEVSLPIKSHNQLPRINIREGFYPVEGNNLVYWSWVGQNNAVIYASASKLENPAIDIEFKIKSAPCLNEQIIDIYHDNQFLKKISVGQKSQEHILSISNSNHGVNRIEFVSDASPCKIIGDDRELLFELKNYKVS